MNKAKEKQLISLGWEPRAWFPGAKLTLLAKRLPMSASYLFCEIRRGKKKNLSKEQFENLFYKTW